MNRFAKKIFILLLILIGVFSFIKALALEINWPTSPMGNDFWIPGSPNPLGDMVRYFYDWGIALGGIATFIALLFGGFLYLTSAGDPARLREAKDRIFSAVTGLALLLGSWLILNTINPELTVLRAPSFEAPKVPSPFNPMAVVSEQRSCEYIVLYENTYWNAKTPASSTQTVNAEYTAKINTTNFRPLSIRFFQPLSPPRITTTTDSTTTAVETCISNKVNITVTTEITMPDGTTISTTTPPSETNIYCEGNHKEGGACTVEFYGPPGWWGLFGPCGDKMGNTNATLHNIKVALGTETDVHCVKVTKTGFD